GRGHLADRILLQGRPKGLLSSLRSFFAIISFMAYTPALAEDVPKGETAFTEYVASLLRRETGAAVAVKGRLTLALGPIQANLDRIFPFCNTNPTSCSREVSTYVKAAAQVYNSQNTPVTKEAIRLVVRTEGYVRSSQASLPKGAQKLLPRPLAGGLVVLPVMDTPRAVRMLSEKDMEALGLSADGVFKLGAGNLNQSLKPLRDAAKPVQSGQIGHLSGDVYNSSRLALLESWAPLAEAQAGKLIAAAPATDIIL